MNIIQISSDHKMFNEEFEGSLENFIYDEFALMYTEGDNIILGFTVFFDPFVEKIEFYLVNYFGEWIRDVVYRIELNDKMNCGYNVYCNKSENKYLEIGHELGGIVLRTMLYIMNTPRERTERPKNTKIPNTQKAESKVSRENKIYLLDEIVDYANQNGLCNIKNNNHKIKCPCWSVRGHYRHYKSGKITFIKNYEKGKEKGKATPKEKTYVI